MKMHKRLFSMLVLLVFMLTLLGGCGSKNSDSDKSTDTSTTSKTSDDAAQKTTDTSASNYSDKTLGLVQPGPEDYYQTFFDRITEAAEHAGMKTYSMLSEYSTEKELSNVEDLIAQGVDAIVIFPLTSDSAQQVTKLCNDSKMPIFIITTEIAKGDGVETCSITNDFFDMGKADGEWLIKNFKGTAKILELQGALGTGIGDNITAGFADSIKDTDYKVVYQADCKWDRATAIKNLEDQISAGLDFNVVFVHNEDMCGGVVSVLKENNLLDKVTVITQNGSQAGFDMLKNKEIACTVTNSPSLVAGETIVRVMQYFDGKLTENKVKAGIYSVDQTNFDDPKTVTWDSSWALDLVDKYLGK